MSIGPQTLNRRFQGRMEPGTLFLLEQCVGAEPTAQPFRAVLACPTCGTPRLITRAQFDGRETMICDEPTCSAEYTLHGDQVRYRRAQ